MLSDPRDNITPRQLELIALYASGLLLEEIATTKFISYSTVKQTLASAKDRVGAKTLTQLCVLCLDNGLIVKEERGYKPIQAERVVGE